MDSLILKHRRMLAQLTPRFRRDFIDEIDWNERMIGIKGARGVGKTTLCLQHIKEQFGLSIQCLYLSLDDIAFPYTSLLQLAEEFIERGGTHLFIDEIHKHPNWTQELKNLYDQFSKLHVVFTGSSILEIDNSRTDLSRRAILYTMHGLSLREFIQIETGLTFPKISLTELLTQHEELSVQISTQTKPILYFEQYLKMGYYPYYLENEASYQTKLSALMSQIIEVDLPILTPIDHEHMVKLKRFLFHLAQQVPFKPNVSQLSTLMQLSRRTIGQYLNLLHQASLLHMVYHNEQRINKLAKPDKLYLHHPNHYYALGQTNVNVGSLRETFFANQLAVNHQVHAAEKGDFLIDGTYLFEVGGSGKTYKQIAQIPNSYLATDNELGIGNKIPLWMFGFLY